MVKARIEKLTLTKFRGSCQSTVFEFDGKKDIVLIFGENGTGKSSIADAIDFVCNCRFGSLRDRSGTTPHKHVVALQASVDELEVTLDYDGQKWFAKLKGRQPVTHPDGQPSALILRRVDIARVMEDSASDRYKALQAFITVPNVEKAESELRQAYKDVGKQVDSAVSHTDNARAALERLWIAEGQPAESAEAWARKQTEQGTTQLQTQQQTAQRVLDVFDESVKARKSLVETAQTVDAAKDGYNRANEAVAQGASAHLGKSDALVVLLSDALRYFESTEDGQLDCPICGKPEATSVMATRVEQQLQELDQLKQLVNARARQEAALTQAQGAHQRAIKQFIHACLVLFQVLDKSETSFHHDVDITPLANTDAASLSDAEAVLDQLAQRRGEVEALRSECQKALHQLTSLQSHLDTIAEHEQTMRKQQALKERLQAMIDIVERERKAYVNNLMAAIHAEVNTLYSRIHPNELIGGSRLQLKERFAGSLDLTADFEGTSNIAPTAYYSEAHLDTLGLCVYLALAKHSGVGNSIVVLDDVLTSVDEVHLDRIIELIADEAPNLGHLIITTHSRAWFDRMRMAKGMNADLFELYGWDIDHGIRHSRTPLHVEELRQAVSASKLDRQGVASKAGVLLEQMLDELTLMYACRVPRKRRAEYTLNELISGINSKLAKALVVEQLDSIGAWQSRPLKPLLDGCSGYLDVRNQVGAHHNPSSAQIPDSRVRDFACHVLALADALICRKCGQLPGRDKSGMYWECGGGCGATRLRPLRAPS